MKYTLEFKLECIDKYKNGIHIDLPPNAKCKERNFFIHNVRNWNKLYDLHGIDGLKHNEFSHVWTKEERFKLVTQVLAGKTISQVSFENKVEVSSLSSWVKSYREKGIEGLELHKGRKPKVPDMPKKKKVKLAPSEKEELELLRARNEYLEAENAYLKKLDALVSKREAAHAKAKKQKSSRK